MDRDLALPAMVLLDEVGAGTDPIGGRWEPPSSITSGAVASSCCPFVVTTLR